MKDDCYCICPVCEAFNPGFSTVDLGLQCNSCFAIVKETAIIKVPLVYK